MDILCPNCKATLEAIPSVVDAYKCSKENIVWELSERKDGRYLEKVYAPADYRGPTVVKIDKVLDK